MFLSQPAMPSRSDEEECQLPSDLEYATQPTDRHKCGAERVPFSGGGSISTFSRSGHQFREAGTGSGAEHSVHVPCNADPPSSSSSTSVQR